MRMWHRKLWISAAIVVSALCLPGGVAADFVINDDLIVDGSACVGFDCVNGESFGFSTLVLKENNLRIMFHDTSTAGSFPSNDWVLQANQTTNGGLNAFSIVDCGNVNNSDSSSCGQTGVLTIQAGAGGNAVFVDSGGRVGFGTANPVLDLHVVSGNTPALRLQQDGSSGFTPQTWDVAGNETNFFIRDATNGSTLPLRIQPGAASSSIFIEGGTSDVGVGTSSPVHALHVRRTNAAETRVQVENGNATAQNVGLRLVNAANTWDFTAATNGNFQITRTGLGFAALAITGSTGQITAGQNLNVVGALSKGSGTFKIDHPLDPENRYLQHSFVESPEMLNIYRGRVELDAEGRAMVTLPEWFGALNRDYLYQLTAIGAPAPGLYVAREIEAGSFEIAGGQPGQPVSWQVTGNRADPYAEANRVEVESWKPQELRGSYLYPAAYGLPAERGETFRAAALANGEPSEQPASATPAAPR